MACSGCPASFLARLILRRLNSRDPLMRRLGERRAMNEWVMSFVEELRQAETLDELTAHIFALRDLMDVEHLVYHSVRSTGEQYGALTYSPEWVERYIDQDYARIDPVVQACFQQFHPLDWSVLDWSGRGRQAFLAEARDAGVGEQGLSVPIRGPSGQFALFTASSRDGADTWRQYCMDHAQSLILAAHFVNQKALEIEQRPEPTDQMKLSPRETETLRMLAMGMNRAQAADALTISEHTLRAYIETARMKLGAQNTTHAVARATVQGLIAF